MDLIRCRFCGKTNAEAGMDRCGYNEAEGVLGHVFVHPDSPGYKKHPYTQYAASLEMLTRRCPKCGVLTREGEGTDGKQRYYSEDSKREHWRECALR